MDPNAVVLEISSDEEADWNGFDLGGISDAGDDHDWLAELLNEVNKENFVEVDGGGDSDEVVVVNEVLPTEKPARKSEFKSSLVESDDDCVILDNDPDKPVKVRNDNPATGNDDSDDLLVVSEKGQVACRDYPHPRHLCIKYPFSSTPKQTHCNQCFCYVCDSLAPCVHWGNGSLSMDHCHATDKEESWRLERQKTKNPKLSDPVQPAPVPVFVPVPRPGLTRVWYTPAIFGAPNITDQTRNPVLVSRNKIHPRLVSPVSLRTNVARSHGLQGPVFKRPGSAGPGATPTTNQYRHGPHRGSFRNSSTQRSHTSSEPPLPSQSNPYPESRLRHQPHLVPSSTRPDPVPCQPSYQVSCKTRYPVPPQTRVHTISPSVSVPVSGKVINTSYPVPPQTQVHTIGPTVLDQVINTARQPVASVNDPSSFLTGYQYHNWIFDDRLVDTGSMDVSGAYFDSEFVDTGPLFDF